MNSKNGSASDLTVFEDLFRTHFQALFRHLYRIVGERGLAEDLAQETFLRLYRQIFEPGRKHHPRAWLYQVATNLAYNAVRDQARHAQTIRQNAGRLSLDAPGDDPQDVLQRSEARQQVRQALAELPPRDAQLLLLRHAGLRYDELAEVLNLAPSSIGSLLSRASRAFAQAYQAFEPAPEGEKGP
ncbi:MAG TPA: sigma-70 family RNA polymerase sigma factor [Anaerolineales bacterium]